MCSKSEGIVSESVEMYLVVTALERKGDAPVHLSVLAERLAISAVSANEMCHKLAERGLVEYQPYKGVTLTTQGEVLAQRVLRRRHLWEALLTEHLTIEPLEAAEIACQLEHISSDRLIEALAAFLDRSTMAVAHPPAVYPLSTLTAGQQGQVVDTSSDQALRGFLLAQGVQAGTVVDVLAVGSDGAVLLELSGHHLSLAHSVAAHIKVAIPDEPGEQ